MSPAHLSMSIILLELATLAMYWNCFTVASRGVQLTKRVDEPYSVKYYSILQVI
jgi:hypothetical protein